MRIIKVSEVSEETLSALITLSESYFYDEVNGEEVVFLEW